MCTGKGTLRLAFACLAAMALSPWAAAANLGISPVRTVLTEKTPAAAITVTNLGSDSKVVQLELVRWTQQGGKDIYVPTRDLLANPPVATIGPGKAQVIRVGLNRPADDTQELAYRLYLQEVPPPPRPGFSGLQVALRVGIPVFVAPKSVPISSVVRWKAARTRAGMIRLTMTNEGNVHVELAEIMLSQAFDGSKPRVVNWHQAATYLLPGQSRDLLLKPEFDWQGDRLNLSARTDQGVVETELVLEKEKQP
jgi:fimbrial chaperone protein